MRFVCGLEYDGTVYFGWQKQKSVITVQECMDLALSTIANHSVFTVCSGRTDRGVHAVMQIIHFDTHAIRNNQSWLNGLNSLLPKDITVLWIQEISFEFHARFSTVFRSYRYLILNKKYQSSFLKNYYFHVRDQLNINNMKYMSKFLIGWHDFSAFKSSGCQSKTSIKHVYSLEIYSNNNFIIIDITANSFLYHMVRNIVGYLITIGLSKGTISYPNTFVNNADLKKKYVTAPPQGLYFLYAQYSRHYHLP
ncbi:tRNA pseudouridine(38-40) synthase TruA [Buchnera aphidicola]|uniref:tRNA pseudouridine synthase A n=1 Tax=Buchnera aphidicola (Cinara strobi) TaxID=1921549 RepID=A0A3B1DL39_9GAMM|nr:tRNA pseudouridine(38-40) synthase TruA [Buchnera aphidicola]VAX76431.1 tRNA pseudouridine synthase A [Buchnera aphidicola (Cinara strobi)]